MVVYLCDRCGYNTQHKPNFKNHLNRKYRCAPILEDINIELIKTKYGINHSIPDPIPQKPSNIDRDKLKITYPETILYKCDNWKSLTTQCEFCNKIFASKWNLQRHYNRCKIKQEKNNLENKLIQENKELKLRVGKLEQDRYTNIKIHNTYNQYNSNSIIINNYGKEDLSYLTPEEMTHYVKNLPPGVIKFIEKIHFNPKHPENNNLRITNKKDSLIQIRKKNKWMFEDKSDVIKSLLSDKYQLLEKHLLYLDKKEISSKDNRVIDRFRNNYEDNVKYMKDLLKKIEILILNNSNTKS